MTAKQERQQKEGRLQKEINEGSQALRVCQSEPFQKAQKAVLDDIYKAFMASEAHDVVRLQALRFQMQVASDFFVQFTRLIETGTMSRKELDTLIEREKAERFGRQFRAV